LDQCDENGALPGNTYDFVDLFSRCCMSSAEVGRGRTDLVLPNNGQN